MTRNLLLLFPGLVLLLFSLNTVAALEPDQVMAELAAHPGGRARFVEKRYLAVLDKPLVASGEMLYRPPDYLEKRTLTPRPETMVLDHDALSLERDKRKLTINLSRQPEAMAFIDSIRDTLSGNRQALLKNYAISLSGTIDKWVLTLLPRDPQIAALVLKITIGGSHGQVRNVEYLQADGDRSVLSIDPIEDK